MAQAFAKWKRLQQFIRVLSKFGFNELIQAFSNNQQLKTDSQEFQSDKVFEKIRMALETLGPTFVKLGQAFANREDILPKELTLELQKLQDNVAVTSIDLDHLLFKELGIIKEEHFELIEENPIAAASIAQVYLAKLKNGNEVVLKVKRPSIQVKIEEDLSIIKMFIKFLRQHVAIISKMHLYEGILAFEASIMQELSFAQELQTMQKFEKFYKENEKVHIPFTYPNYCSNEIICMEYIEGAKITDTQFFKTHNINIKQLAILGFHTYLDQVLQFGNFHADPHAGNIIIQANGRLTFIDFGTVGVIAPKDKTYLEDFILYLLTSNTSKLIDTLKNIAITYNIKDEQAFQKDIESILLLIKDSSIANVDPKTMLEQFKNLVHENEILLPSYIYLLVRGIMLMESIARTIYPEMKIMEALQPYLFKIIKNRMHWKYWGPESLSYLNEVFILSKQLPQQANNLLQKIENGALNINGKLYEQNIKNKKHFYAQILWTFILFGACLLMTIIYKDYLINSNNWNTALPIIFTCIIILGIYQMFFKKNK